MRTTYGWCQSDREVCAWGLYSALVVCHTWFSSLKVLNLSKNLLSNQRISVKNHNMPHEIPQIIIRLFHFWYLHSPWNHELPTISQASPGCRGFRRADQGAEAPGAAEDLAPHGPSAQQPRARGEAVEKDGERLGKSWEIRDLNRAKLFFLKFFFF